MFSGVYIEVSRKNIKAPSPKALTPVTFQRSIECCDYRAMERLGGKTSHNLGVVRSAQSPFRYFVYNCLSVRRNKGELCHVNKYVGAQKRYKGLQQITIVYQMRRLKNRAALTNNTMKSLACSSTKHRKASLSRD